MPADEIQLLYSLCLHGRGELGLAPDEYAALTMVLLRLLAFKPPGTAVIAPTPETAAELSKKPLLPLAPELQSLSVAASVARPEPLTPSFQAKNPSDALPAAVSMTEDASDLVATQPPPWIEITAAVEASAAAQVTGNAQLCDVWNATVAQLVMAEAVAALTRELALQSELRSQSDSVWTLRVERESLNQAAAKEKLQLALQTALADPALRIAVEIGPVTDTPARRNTAAGIERQRAAEETIHNDPFVQGMIRDWGAKIVPGSIKPITAVSIRTA
jgi:DNA polymerase-3 subunit gamma/tau